MSSFEMFVAQKLEKILKNQEEILRRLEKVEEQMTTQAKPREENVFGSLTMEMMRQHPERTASCNGKVMTIKKEFSWTMMSELAEDVYKARNDTETIPGPMEHVFDKEANTCNPIVEVVISEALNDTDYNRDWSSLSPSQVHKLTKILRRKQRTSCLCLLVLVTGEQSLS